MYNNLIEEDQQQRKLALDQQQSFIVEAPAGSGKTELLIQRFLTLLGSVQLPEEILAITFTKKAANEMRLRIMNALNDAKSNIAPEADHKKLTFHLAKRVLERDKELQWHLNENPNQLRIKTIDSLCSYLTKQLPLLSHFGATPEIIDNPSTLYSEAVREVIMHVEGDYEWSPALTALLLHLDNDLNKLHDLLVNLLAKRDQWIGLVSLRNHPDKMRTQLECNLEAIICESLEKCHDLIPYTCYEALTGVIRFATSNLSLIDSQHELMRWNDFKKIPPPLAKNKLAYHGLANLLLTKTHSWRKKLDVNCGFPPLKQLKNPEEIALHKEYRQQFSELVATLSDSPGLLPALIDILYLPQDKYTLPQWEVLQSLLQVMQVVAAQLRLTFKQYGQIDFIENAQAALLALGNEEQPTDLALALDYQIKHILVDEFQDTSYTQYQLLKKLICGWQPDDGRTLFVVGDPMQSIYRFREAEVGLFIRMIKKGIGELQLTPISLKVNFRSVAQLVEWNNKTFKSIFPAHSDIATGAVAYKNSVSCINQTHVENAINITGLIDADGSVQASHIVTLIKNLREKNPLGKIALLVRSRSHLVTIMPALKKANLPYRAVEIDSLASKQSIQDLLSLTCALIHPADRIAWLAVLRAPWCGLSLHDLFIIANKNPHLTIWERLNTQVLNELSSDGQARLHSILPILKSKIANRNRDDLRAWIEDAWLKLGGPACLNTEDDIEDTNVYFELLNSLNQAQSSLNLSTLHEKVASLFAAPNQDDKANIQIMTIHSAKGLEFDYVILPHLEKKNPHDNKALLAWIDRPLTNGANALLLAPIHATGNETDPIYDYIYRQQRAKSDYETDRLLYVAATRAKKALYLYFNATVNDNGDCRIETGSFLAKLWPAIKHQQASILNRVTQTKEAVDSQKQKYLFRLKKNWQHPIPFTAERSTALHYSQSGFLLTDTGPKVIGMVMHKLLERISRGGIAWWSDKSIQQQKSYLHYQLRQEGLLISALQDGIMTIHTAIENMLADERGRWILQAHQDAKSEYAITASLDGKITRLILDRTFIYDNIRWIIDYKTSTFTHGELDDFLNNEYKKYSEKMYAYYQAIQLDEIHPIRLGLYFPILSAWIEWEPESELI